MKIHFFLLIALSFLTLAAVSVPAAERGPKGNVKIGIFPFMPFNFIDSAGNTEGLNPDLLREIIKDERWRIEFVPGSWAEGLQRLHNEEIDLMMSVAYSPERAEIMDYSYESVAELWGQVFLRPENNPKNINDLDGKRVGIMQKDISGSNFIETARKFGVECEIVEFASHSEVFQAVQQKSVVAGVAPQHFGLRHAKEYDLVGSTILFSPFSIYFASKKGTQHELLSHIDAHLANWKKDKNSYYYQRLNYWLGNTSSRVQIPSWVLYIGLTVFVLMLFSTAFILLLKRTVRFKTQELAQSEKKLLEAHEIASMGRWELDVPTNRLTWSDGIYTLFEINRTTSTASYEAFFKYIHPDDRTLVAQAYLESLENRTTFNIEHRILLRSGRIKWVSEIGRTEYNDEGDPVRSVGTVQDITGRKKVEEENKYLQRQLLQAQKMEAIGTLAGGIAHDFNNILAAILGYAELVKEDVPPGSVVEHEIDQVIQAGNRARDLVKQILDFSRQAETEKVPLQPGIIIKETLKLLRSSMPTTIVVEQNIDMDSGLILADQIQIHQLLMNVCTNAFQAMEEKGGKLIVSLTRKDFTAEDLADIIDIRPGTFVQISIKDNGPGIPPAVQEKIFNPYFTTKEIGKGSGMGLAIVHGIVKSNGGFLTFSSRVGEGTVFHINLPVVEKTLPKTSPIGLIPLGNERILFVDDETLLAEMGKAMLERVGYAVTSLTSSIDAFNTFKSAPDAFDLVITDQTMPEMTGVDMAQKMLEIRPGLPIILCTGYSNLISENQAKSLGIKGFALKPLTRKDITTLIRKILDQEKPAGTSV